MGCHCTFIYLQGTLGRCSSSIFFVLTYILVLKTLSDKFFFLSTEIGFLGVKIAPKNWDIKYLFICFTYNIVVIFRNETEWKNFLTMRDETCDFGVMGWTPENYFSLLKSDQKIWKKYMLLTIIQSNFGVVHPHPISLKYLGKSLLSCLTIRTFL